MPIEGRRRCGRGGEHIRSELFEQAFLSLPVAAEVEHGHPARSQHKRCQLFGVVQAACPQRFEGNDEYLLHEVVRCMFISQMPQAVEADTGSHAPEELGLGFRSLAESDLAHQIRIIQLNFHQHVFYV